MAKNKGSNKNQNQNVKGDTTMNANNANMKGQNKKGDTSKDNGEYTNQNN